MDEERWQEISRPQAFGFAIGFVAFLVLAFWNEPGFVPVLDHANLLFHEAGHPIIGLLSERLGVYGGTIGQLVFPVVLAISVWRQGQAPAFGAALIWFFENWLNIARYMADARAQELPLVGGGDHDWNTIFSQWNILAHDTQIASIVKITAWGGIAGAAAWVAWRVFKGRKV
jgi:hypothetical protein